MLKNVLDVFVWLINWLINWLIKGVFVSGVFGVCSQ